MSNLTTSNSSWILTLTRTSKCSSNPPLLVSSESKIFWTAKPISHPYYARQSMNMNSISRNSSKTWETSSEITNNSLCLNHMKVKRLESQNSGREPSTILTTKSRISLLPIRARKGRVTRKAKWRMRRMMIFRSKESTQLGLSRNAVSQN